MTANGVGMRNRQLHAALVAFAEEAGHRLAAATAEGHELPFEVVETGGGRGRDTPLYCYRPLTGRFIADRAPLLGGLETFLPAVHALAATDGLDDYLEARGVAPVPRERRPRAEAALRAFLTVVFQDSTDFEIVPERLGRALAELEEVVHEGRAETVVVVPVLGLALVAGEVPMGDGLTLMRGDVLEDAPEEAVWPRDAEGPAVLAVVRWEPAAGEGSPVDTARARLARLLTALRLFDPAGVALGPAAWTRTAGGAWGVAIHGLPSARPRGRCVVRAEDEDELRAFCSLVTRRTPRSGELAWALRRFELGCASAEPADALTDHLLALRALLEPEGPQSGRLAGRVAALCAEPHERAALTRRMAHVVELERNLVAGVGLPERAVLATIAAEVADHLRAILRDLLCGHLDPAVRDLADRLLAEEVTDVPASA